MAWNRFATNKRPGPLTLRGRLGSGFVRSIVVPAIEPWPETKDTLLSRNFRRSVLQSAFFLEMCLQRYTLYLKGWLKKA